MGPWSELDDQDYDEVEERLRRHDERMAAIDAGAPALSVDELFDLMKRTSDAYRAAGPGDRAALAVQLEDMHREYELRTFMRDDTTKWPA